MTCLYTLYIPCMCQVGISLVSTTVIYEVEPEEWEMRYRIEGDLLWIWCWLVQWSGRQQERTSLSYWSIIYLLLHLHASYTQTKGWRWWQCSKLEDILKERNAKLGFWIIGYHNKKNPKKSWLLLHELL